MKILLIIILWLTGSFACYNTNTKKMDNILNNIKSLVTGDSVNKQVIESELHIKLSEDKKESATQGMLIYRLSSTLSDYLNAELRIFSGNTRFFLLLFPEYPIPLQLEELKKVYTYKSFTAGDVRRDELPGYEFETNGREVNFYCDEALDNIIQITVMGKTN